MEENSKKPFIIILLLSIILSSIAGGAMGFLGASMVLKDKSNFGNNLAEEGKVSVVREESAVISAVEKASPAVVNIIVTKDLPKMEQYQAPQSDFFKQFFGENYDLFFNAPQYRQNGTEKKEIGGGSGFIVSSDGYVVTNRHVVVDEAAEYTVLANDDKKYSAKVLARDPVNDLAVLKIDANNLPTVDLGDSSRLKVGQRVIAIGNALGEFNNTVSTGIVSGLSRSITAEGTGVGSEKLSGVIQTDASINLGNSGGPLLNIAGQVIGINTAIATEAQNIGFAIPINEVKNIIKTVRETGRFARPWLGVRYILVTEEIAKENELTVNYGALIIRGDKSLDLAIVPGSPANKAGLEESDIILEIDGKRIDENNPLSNAVGRFKPDDEIKLKVLHKGEEKEIKVKLDEMK